jgi:EAL domain-containing protein (putative c-di-GMP-specific phosphodiesterase class I)
MTKEIGCRACRAGTTLDFDFTMAFQPIVDVGTGSVWAYEALVRGPNGEPAPKSSSAVRKPCLR